MNSIQATSHERVKLQSSNFCMFLALSPITWLLGSDRLPHFSALHCPSHCCRAAIPGQWLQRKAQRLFGRDPFEQANWASPRTLSSLSFLLLAIVESVFSRSHHISTFLHLLRTKMPKENSRNPNAPGLPPFRADIRTFSYVLGFSALLIFTVLSSCADHASWLT